MLPLSITLQKYRSFLEPVTLELRPITLLFGINNAGKSALLRALPLVADSAAGKISTPLDLESAALRGASFQDLRWKGRLPGNEDEDLVLSLRWSEPKPFQVKYHLHWFRDWRRLVVRRFQIQSGDLEMPGLQGEWQLRREDRTGQFLTYALEARSHSQVRLSFRGLSPEVENVEGDWGGHHLEELRSRLAPLPQQVQWLTAARIPPTRFPTFPAAPMARIKADGSDTAAVLASRPEILARVSHWYEEWMQRRLRIQEVPPSNFRLMLQNLAQAKLDVDLADTGEGMVQVLPVITAVELNRLREDGGPGIVAIEEPESHLHPQLQRALAEYLCSAVEDDNGSRIVLETHSEHLLLGLQLEIARGRLQPEHVLVYWVRQEDSGESFAETITFDRQARPQGPWPPGVFSGDNELAREIILARRELANTE